MPNTIGIIETISDIKGFSMQLLEWLATTSSSAIGAAAGALLAYVFGFKLLRVQLTHTEHREKRKFEFEREKYIYMFFEDCETAMNALKSAVILGIDTCRYKKANEINNVSAYCDDIHRNYLKYRLYFADDQINLFRRLHRLNRNYEGIAFDYARAIQSGNSNNEKLESDRARLLPLLEEIDGTFDRINKYNPMNN